MAHASEDVGLANPQAMVQAVAAATALEHIGMPEARLSLAQAIIFVCESPKSNSVVMAVDQAFRDAENTYDEPVPVHLRDTHYRGRTSWATASGTSTRMISPGITWSRNICPVRSRKEYYTPSSEGRRLIYARAARTADGAGRREGGRIFSFLKITWSK